MIDAQFHSHFGIQMSGSGFLSVFAAAMVLQPVEELSDEQGEENVSTPSAKANEKKTVAKGKAKAKSSSSKKGEAKAKAKPASSKKSTKEPAAPKGPKGDAEDTPAAAAKKPATKALKRPAAAEKSEKLSIGRYKYPNGSFGYKVNGKQVLTATCFALIVKPLIHKIFTSVWTYWSLTVIPCAR